MTCTTTTRRTSIPALLLALHEAEKAEAAAWDAHVWASNDTTRPAGEREAVASQRLLRWVAANEAMLTAAAEYDRARIEATYPECEE